MNVLFIFNTMLVVMTIVQLNLCKLIFIKPFDMTLQKWNFLLQRNVLPNSKDIFSDHKLGRAFNPGFIAEQQTNA